MMNIKKTLYLIIAVLCLSGCSSQKTETSERDKTVVTMLYAGELTKLEKLVETTYTDIDFQIEKNAQGTIDGEVERRLRNGHGSDIVASALATGDY